VQVPHWAEPVPVDVADDVGAVVVAVVVTGAEDDVTRVVDDVVTAVAVMAEEDAVLVVVACRECKGAAVNLCTAGLIRERDPSGAGRRSETKPQAGENSPMCPKPAHGDNTFHSPLGNSRPVKKTGLGRYAGCTAAHTTAPLMTHELSSPGDQHVIAVGAR
jgi:hypothetical protein